MVPARCTMPVIEFRDVCKRVSSRYETTRKDALVDLSFSVEQGECVVVLGPSGAGKSTLLRLLLALDVPDAGRICVAGLDLSRLTPAQLPALRRQIAAALVPPRFMESRSARANVALALEVVELPEPVAQLRAREVLAALGFSAALETPVCHLATGERKIVALARALATRPPIVVLDQLVEGVDEPVRRRMYDELARARRDGSTIIYAASSAPPRKQLDADRRVRLDAGRLVEHRYTPVRVAGKSVREKLDFQSPRGALAWRRATAQAAKSRASRAAGGPGAEAPTLEESNQPMLDLLPAGQFARISSGEEDCFKLAGEAASSKSPADADSPSSTLSEGGRPV